MALPSRPSPQRAADQCTPRRGRRGRRHLSAERRAQRSALARPRHGRRAHALPRASARRCSTRTAPAPVPGGPDLPRRRRPSDRAASCWPSSPPTGRTVTVLAVGTWLAAYPTHRARHRRRAVTSSATTPTDTSTSTVSAPRRRAREIVRCRDVLVATGRFSRRALSPVPVASTPSAAGAARWPVPPATRSACPTTSIPWTSPTPAPSAVRAQRRPRLGRLDREHALRPLRHGAPRMPRRPRRPRCSRPAAGHRHHAAAPVTRRCAGRVPVAAPVALLAACTASTRRHVRSSATPSATSSARPLGPQRGPVVHDVDGCRCARPPAPGHAGRCQPARRLRRRSSRAAVSPASRTIPPTSTCPTPTATTSTSSTSTR